MKKIICSLLIGAFLVSCGQSLSDVKVGMTESEVTDLLGDANHRSESSNSTTFNGEVEAHSTASWEYDGLCKIEFVDGIVVSITE